MRYTCQRCGFSGTKKDREWYQSEHSDEVVCGQCYEFIKQLESEKQELTRQQKMIYESRQKQERSFRVQFNESVYRNVIILVVVVVFSLAGFFGALYLLNIDDDADETSEMFYGFWQNMDTNDSIYALVFSEDGRLVVYNSSEWFMVGSYYLNTTHFIGMYQEGVGEDKTNQTISFSYDLHDDVLVLDEMVFEKVEEPFE